MPLGYAILVGESGPTIPSECVTDLFKAQIFVFRHLFMYTDMNKKKIIYSFVHTCKDEHLSFFHVCRDEQRKRLFILVIVNNFKTYNIPNL